jgi:hypothetical protein
MPFDGKNKVRFDHDHDPDARAQAFQTSRGSARETIAALDHLAALFDGGRRWLRNKECDEKGRFCLCGGIAHIAAGDYVGYYLRVAIRELAGPSMTIPAYNDSRPEFRLHCLRHQPRPRTGRGECGQADLMHPPPANPTGRMPT